MDSFEGGLPPVFLRQQQRFDQQLSVYRRWYFTLSKAEQALFRANLEKTQALWREFPIGGVSVNVLIENEEIDEEGEITDYENCQFSGWTLLEAVKKWDAGDTLTPDTTMP